MADYRWRDEPNIIARLVNADKIKTFSTQQVIIKPNEAMAMIMDGRIGDILSETVVKNLAGGFGRWFGEQMGVTATDRRLLFAMTGPMDYMVPFEAAMSDGQMAKGHANLRLKIAKDDLPKLLNIFANRAPILRRNDVTAIIQTELLNKVIQPCVAACNGTDDLRGSLFQERLEMTAEMEMRNLLSNMGFTLLKAFAITNPTDMELVDQHRARQAAIAAGESVNAEHAAHMFHQQEISALARIEMEVSIARAQAAGKVTVEMESELKDLRKREAHWQAEFKRDKALQDLELEKVETLHGLDQDKKQAKVDQAMAMFEQVQAKKTARVGQMQDHQNQRMDHQNDMQMKMMEMAKEAGALTPEVMQEFFKQQTAQKAIDGDGTEGGSQYSSSPTAKSQPPPPPNNCCGLVIQPGWSACPKCGKNLA
ncbi:MAG: hypothetical protein ACKVJ7_02310 [Candidatus Poseidoniales archaeon]|jgi:hypothetical protein